MVSRRKAIILVAGMGTRLKPLTLSNHKCLTEVNGTPILINTLQILNDCGFEQVTLVVGYLKELVQKRIGTRFGNMDIVYVENDIYNQTNTSWSLQLGLNSVSDYEELFIIEGDVFFEKKLLDDLINYSSNVATVLEKYRPELDGTFVTLGADNTVTDWTHKSHQSTDYKVEDKYKTVNIHRFHIDFIEKVLEKYLQENIAVHKGKEPLENIMETLVHENPRLVSGFVLDGQKWFEIDDTEDLAKAERIFAQ